MRLERPPDLPSSRGGSGDWVRPCSSVPFVPELIGFLPPWYTD